MKLCKTCKHTHVAMYVQFDTCCRSVRVKGINLQNGNEIIGGWRATRDERESGMLIPSFRIGGGLALGACTVPDFERFAALVAAAERKACAKLCESLGGASSSWHAEAIRARVDK